MADLSFRSATQNDSIWLWALRQLTMEAYITQSYGWIEADQYQYAQEHLDSTQIIQVNKGQDAGMLKLLTSQHKVHIAQLQIHPQYAGQGIGTKILMQIIDQAKANQQIVELHVLKNNPAQNLYKRLGFSIVEEVGFQYLMRLG